MTWGEVLGIAGEGVLREPGEEHSGWYEGGALGLTRKCGAMLPPPVILRRCSRRRIFPSKAGARGGEKILRFAQDDKRGVLRLT